MNKKIKLSIIVLALVVLSLAISTTVSAAGEAEAGLIGGTICLIFLIPIIIGIVLAIWVYKDAEKRGSSGVLWLLIVLVTGIIGLIIWLVVRPPIGGQPGQQQQQQGPGRVCPSCGRPIPMDAQVCPYCGNRFGP